MHCPAGVTVGLPAPSLSATAAHRPQRSRACAACKLSALHGAQDETRSNLITATAASSLVACFIMGAFANMPVGLAPGLGLNAYLSYNLVGEQP